jgi:hypothetical protein
MDHHDRCANLSPTSLPPGDLWPLEVLPDRPRIAL